MKYYKLPVVFFIFSSSFVSGQSTQCQYWPAPCPHKTEISNAQDWTVAKNNGRLPQEMLFEGMLRSRTDKIVSDIALKNQWQVYEFNESSFNTPLAANEKGIIDTVPFEKRPPHLYVISYIFIISPSMMKQWTDWLEDFRYRTTKSFTEITKTSEPDEKQKALFDSAMFYTNLRLKYMQDHQDEYTKAIKANDDKYLKRYESQSEAYTKKSNDFIDRYNEFQKETSAGPEQKLKAFQEEETNKNVYYRDASTILIKFSFNEPKVGSGIIDPANDRNIQPQKHLDIQGFQFAAITHNPLPAEHITTEEGRGIADFDFEHPTDIGLLLVDGWDLQSDTRFGFYHAAYTKDLKNTGYRTKKPVATDHLRNAAIFLEGKNDSVQDLMKQINVQEFKDIIEH